MKPYDTNYHSQKRRALLEHIMHLLLVMAILGGASFIPGEETIKGPGQVKGSADHAIIPQFGRTLVRPYQVAWNKISSSQKLQDCLYVLRPGIFSYHVQSLGAPASFVHSMAASICF